MKVVRGLFDSAHVQVIRTILAKHTAGEKRKKEKKACDVITQIWPEKGHVGWPISQQCNAET